MTRSQIKRRFCQFSRTVAVMDLRVHSLLRKASEYAKRHNTCGKRAAF